MVSSNARGVVRSGAPAKIQVDKVILKVVAEAQDDNKNGNQNRAIPIPWMGMDSELSDCRRWGAFGSARENFHVHQGQHFLKGWPIDVLCHNVRRVFGSRDFMQSHGTHADFLLAPEICCVKMPYFAKSASPAYAQRSCGVGMEADGIVEAQIPG